MKKLQTNPGYDYGFYFVLNGFCAGGNTSQRANCQLRDECGGPIPLVKS